MSVYFSRMYSWILRHAVVLGLLLAALSLVFAITGPASSWFDKQAGDSGYVRDFKHCYEVEFPDSVRGLDGRPSILDFEPDCRAYVSGRDPIRLQVKHEGATSARFRYHSHQIWDAGQKKDIVEVGSIDGNIAFLEFPNPYTGPETDHILWFVDLSNENGVTTSHQMVFSVENSHE